jgi:REP element-mobilizing transposase RayT
MPDHWHGLIELGDVDDLSMLVRRMKGVSARAMNRTASRHGSVSAEGFHDHAIRADESLRDVARYIVLNPLRAGLVDRVGLYPYWDAIWLETLHPG